MNEAGCALGDFAEFTGIQASSAGSPESGRLHHWQVWVQNQRTPRGEQKTISSILCVAVVGWIVALVA